MTQVIQQEIEQWKLKMIIQAARRKGFRRGELADVQQQVVLALMNFEYDPEKSNGASERTVLGWYIDRLLTNIQRTEARQKKNTKKIIRVCGPGKFEPMTDNAHLDHERECELKEDVQHAVSKMTDQERAICQALSTGTARCSIASNLGISRYELERIITRIAEQFANKGIDEWVRR